MADTSAPISLPVDSAAGAGVESHGTQHVDSSAHDDVVRLGETVLLVLNDDSATFAVVRPFEHIRLKKASFEASLLIGAAYGTVYEATPKRTIELVESGELMPSWSIETGSGADNRTLVDDNTSQTLTQDEITRMKTEGKAGSEIIAALIENSATFATKTAFSQEKYIKKKQQKYLTRFRVLRPTARLICDTLLEKNPERMCGLRSDSLAQLLTAANVHVGGRTLVVDSVGGLLIGAVAERMGTSGVIISIEEPKKVNCPAWAHAQKFNLGRSFDAASEEHLKIFTVDMQQITDWAICPEGMGSARTELPVVSGQKRPRPVGMLEGDDTRAPHKTLTQDDAGATDSVKEDDVNEGGDAAAAGALRSEKFEHRNNKHLGRDGKPKPVDPSAYHSVRALRITALEKCKELMKGVDSVIVVSDCKPNLLLLTALRYAKPSAAFAVFCSEMQPLAETYRHLRSLQVSVNNNLNETWYREYQVLPNRTHPTMSMHGASGYLLSGVVIQNTYTVVPFDMPS